MARFIEVEWSEGKGCAWHTCFMNIDTIAVINPVYDEPDVVSMVTIEHPRLIGIWLKMNWATARSVFCG